MGVNESELKRMTNKDEQLQQKLIITRKKIDSLGTNLQKIKKKPSFGYSTENRIISD